LLCNNSAHERRKKRDLGKKFLNDENVYKINPKFT
jgi:hypothetical protein